MKESVEEVCSATSSASVTSSSSLFRVSRGSTAKKMAAASRGSIKVGGCSCWEMAAYCLYVGLLVMGSLLAAVNAETAIPTEITSTKTSSSPSSITISTTTTTSTEKELPSLMANTTDNNKETSLLLTNSQSQSTTNGEEPSTKGSSDSPSTASDKSSSVALTETNEGSTSAINTHHELPRPPPGATAGGAEADRGIVDAFAQSGGAASLTTPPPGATPNPVTAAPQPGATPSPAATVAPQAGGGAGGVNPAPGVPSSTPKATVPGKGTSTGGAPNQGGSPTKQNPTATGQQPSTNGAGFPNLLGKNNETFGNADPNPWEGKKIEESDSNVRLQEQIYILSGVFGFFGLIQFIISISLAVSVSSLHAKLRRLSESVKPTPGFGTLNRGYLRTEMEMGDFGGGLDELSTRYDQHGTPGPGGNMPVPGMGLQGIDYNGYGSPASAPKAGIAVNRPAGFPRPHWVGERAARNYS